jgi:hypothetical protein
MGRACNMYMSEEKCMQSFGRKPKGKREAICRWEGSTEMCLKEIGWESVGQIYLAQNRDQWQALVNKIMNFWFNKTLIIS